MRASTMLGIVRDALEGVDGVTVERVTYPVLSDPAHPGGLLITTTAGSRFLVALTDANAIDAAYAASGIPTERGYVVDR